MSAPRTMPSLDPGTFPTLAQFVGAYLHQDFMLEHGTAEAARDAFLQDASSGERSAFAAEVEGYRAACADLPWTDVRRAFAALGGAWAPPSRARLNALLSVPALRTARSPRATRRRS